MKIWLHKEIDKIGIMLKRKRDRKVVPLERLLLKIKNTAQDPSYR